MVECAIDEVAMTADSRDDACCVPQGFAQRLENGNPWIGWGLGTNLLGTEVTPEGEVVFELRARTLEGEVHSYRAWRFAD